MIFNLASVCPREMTQVLACCNPIPPLVRLNAHNLVEVHLFRFGSVHVLIVNQVVSRAKQEAKNTSLPPAPITPLPPVAASIGTTITSQSQTLTYPAAMDMQTTVDSPMRDLSTPDIKTKKVTKSLCVCHEH